MLIEAGELSAIILIVVSLASVFAWATNTLGQPTADAVVGLGLGNGILALLMFALIIIGMSWTGFPHS